MNKVQLYVYDLLGGMAPTLSQMALGIHVDAVYHTSVVVFGKEYFYGGGAPSDDFPGITIWPTPGTTDYGRPIKIMDMGSTRKTLGEWEMKVKELGETEFKANRYRILDFNCNTFTSAACLYLVGADIPQEIKKQHEILLSSPTGRMLAPILERLNGGNPADLDLGSLLGGFGGMPGLGSPSFGRAEQRMNPLSSSTSFSTASSKPQTTINPASATFSSSRQVKSAFSALLDDTPEMVTVNSLSKPRALEMVEKVSRNIGMPDSQIFKVRNAIENTLTRLVASRSFGSLSSSQKDDMLAVKRFIVEGLKLTTLEESVVVLDVARLLALFQDKEFDFFQMEPVYSIPEREKGEGGASLLSSIVKNVKCKRFATVRTPESADDPKLNVSSGKIRSTILLLVGRLLCNNIAGHGMGLADLKDAINGAVSLLNEEDVGVVKMAVAILVNVAICTPTADLVSEQIASSEHSKDGINHLLLAGGSLINNLRIERQEELSARALGRLLIATFTSLSKPATGEGVCDVSSPRRLLEMSRQFLGLISLTKKEVELMVGRETIETKKELIALVHRMG